eukprot:2724881-Rhodomonas_salina.3
MACGAVCPRVCYVMCGSDAMRGVRTGFAAKSNATRRAFPAQHGLRYCDVAALVRGAALDGELFPAGEKDVEGQQLDLRRVNSWLLRLPEVWTNSGFAPVYPELARYLSQVWLPLGIG